MTWRYDQSSGEISRNGTIISRGYSGHDRGKNNPSMQAAVGIGPIPAGGWTMTSVGDSPHTGPFTIVLEPLPGTKTFGRSEFRIHGDSIAHPGTASHGCIIMPRDVRRQIWGSGDRDLVVDA